MNVIASKLQRFISISVIWSIYEFGESMKCFITQSHEFLSRSPDANKAPCAHNWTEWVSCWFMVQIPVNEKYLLLLWWLANELLCSTLFHFSRHIYYFLSCWNQFHTCCTFNVCLMQSNEPDRHIESVFLLNVFFLSVSFSLYNFAVDMNATALHEATETTVNMSDYKFNQLVQLVDFFARCMVKPFKWNIAWKFFQWKCSKSFRVNESSLKSSMGKGIEKKDR